MPRESHIRPPRIADQQYSQQLIVLSGERDRMHRFIVQRIRRPMNERAGLPGAAADLLDERSKRLGLRAAYPRVDQQLRRKSALPDFDRAWPACRGKFEAGQKIFVQAPSPDHIERLVPDGHLANGGKAQGRAIRKLFLLKKRILWACCGKSSFPCSRTWPAIARRKEWFPGRPQTRGNPVAGLRRCSWPHSERQRSPERRGSAVKAIRVAASLDAIALDPRTTSSPRRLNSRLELRDQGRGALIVGSLESSPRDRGNNCGHRRHRQENCQREYRQQFAPKIHGFHLPAPSQTSSRRQLSIRAVAPIPYACAHAIARAQMQQGNDAARDCSSVLSAVYKSSEESAGNLGCGKAEGSRQRCKRNPRDRAKRSESEPVARRSWRSW